MKVSDEWYGRILSLPGIILIFLLVIVPLATLVRTSFLRYNFVSPVKFIGLGNFRDILHDRLFWHSLKVTIIYTVGVTSLSLVISLIMASSLSKIGERRFSTLLRTLAILPFAVPLILSGLVWRWLLDPAIGSLNYLLVSFTPASGPINIFGSSNGAMLGVIMADAWVKIPFMTIFILSAIDSIGQDLYDAAKVDGAHALSTFRRITLPLARNGILYAVLITSMFSFRTIDVIWSMTKGGPGKGTYHIGLYVVDNLLSRMAIGRASVIGILIFIIIAIFVTGLLYWMSREV